MPFNYMTGQYEPDTPPPVTNGPTVADWLRLAGFNPNYDYVANQPNPNAPGTNPNGPAGQPTNLNGGGIDPVTGRPAGGPANNPASQSGPPIINTQGSGQQPPWTPPTVPGPLARPVLPNVGDGRLGPSQQGYTVTGQTAAPNLGTFSGNTGTDPSRPPDTSGDWFFSGGHWVDKTGQRDATGRYLTDAEKAYYAGYDHARAGAAQSGEQSILTNYLANNKNPGLPAGNQPSYVPYTSQPTAISSPAATAPAANPTPAVSATTGVGIGGGDPQSAAWDYSKPNSVPWQAFLNNLFAETNAKQNGFAEVQGVMDATKLQQATDVYGWQVVPNSGNPDANVVYRAAAQAASADPTSDYVVIKTVDANGQPGYGVVKREQNVQAQQARGFYAPGQSPEDKANTARRNSGGGGGGRGATTYGYGKQGTGQKGQVGPNGPTTQEIQDAQRKLATGVSVAKGGLMNAAEILRQQQQRAAQNQAVQRGIGNVLGKVFGNVASNPAVQNAATPIAYNGPPTPLLPPAGSMKVPGYYWDGHQWVIDQPDPGPNNQPTFYGDNFAG